MSAKSRLEEVRPAKHQHHHELDCARWNQIVASSLATIGVAPTKSTTASFFATLERQRLETFPHISATPVLKFLFFKQVFVNSTDPPEFDPDQVSKQEQNPLRPLPQKLRRASAWKGFYTDPERTVPKGKLRSVDGGCERKIRTRKLWWLFKSIGLRFWVQIPGSGCSSVVRALAYPSDGCGFKSCWWRTFVSTCLIIAGGVKRSHKLFSSSFKLGNCMTLSQDLKFWILSVSIIEVVAFTSKWFECDSWARSIWRLETRLGCICYFSCRVCKTLISLNWPRLTSMLDKLNWTCKRCL